MILLPREIYALRPVKNQIIRTDREEYNIYYHNVVYPWREENQIQVLCDYGCDLGRCWRLDEFPDVPSFPLTLRVKDCWGEVIESAEATVHILDRPRAEAPVRVMFIGDSMTHTGTYIEQVAQKLDNCVYCGSRQRHGIRREGRGGWTIARYMEQSAAYQRGVSPFLFPRDVSGADYYGDYDFWREGLESPTADPYNYDGFDIRPIRENQVYLKDGRLWRFHEGAGDELVSDDARFEFSFAKYRERFGVEKPQVVSLLFGANEVQRTETPELNAKIADMLAHMEHLIEGIRADCPAAKMIVNMPVTGAGQYAWGVRLGCRYTAKQYHLNIVRLNEAILKKYDGRESEGFYVSPMLAAIDPEYGFESTADRANRYTDALIVHHTNWVHPCEAGYRQMGDALASVIEKARQDITAQGGKENG